MLNNKQGVKYTMLKDVFLEQLLIAVSTSDEESVIRASVIVLTTIVSANTSIMDDIKKKGLRLKMKTLELLPTLVDVICTSNGSRFRPSKSLTVTPPAASLMIGDATNNRHLAAINSPHIPSRFLDVARNHSLEEHISLATILVKCMQFDGMCRKYISQAIAVAPFIHLLQSNENRAVFIELKFFHQVFRIPRSSTISLLQQIQREGGIDIMDELVTCVHCFRADYRILAANLLLQLDTLTGKSVFQEEAMQVLFQSLASEESTLQLLSAFVLSNIGGTYSWTGESNTVAWLGLKSQIKRVARESLMTIAWLGCEISKSSNSLRCSACEILLGEVEKFLHPGMDLEERLLACLCIYNYASGKEQRISCVHTQIVEASNKYSGAVNALIYDKGMLFSGYSNGSIKAIGHPRMGRESAGGKLTSIITANDVVVCFTESGLIKGWIPLVLGSQVSALLTLVTIIDLSMDTDG
ncbi:hypothetical protein V6N11_046599 [Hibiscus sabdariffa]|uniref:Uncharacterized protein n=1 Tax=Hibiscus sabdariffa TaxID=183260 RepID=A0ABR2P2Q0_9ROSI